MEDKQNQPGRDFPKLRQDIAQGILGFKKPAELLITLVYVIPALGPIQVCVEAGIFEHFQSAAESDGKALSAETLAEGLPQNVFRTSNDKQRHRRGGRLVNEGEEAFTYRANALTHELTEPGMAASFLHVFDQVIGPKSTISCMLPFAQENSFCPPTTADNGPYQQARDIVGIAPFDFYERQEPWAMTRLNAFMLRVQKDRQHWVEWFPEDVLWPYKAGTDASRADFVDVAGGLGHGLLALANKYTDPDLRVILQDLHLVIGEGKALRAEMCTELDDRITLWTHNFSTPQPVRRAGVKYMHKIMHDWPDLDCVRILTQLRDAMAPDSRVFVNNLIVPDKGATLLQAAFDIIMLALHNGQERDEQM